MTLSRIAPFWGLAGALALAACGERDAAPEEAAQVEAVIVSPTDAFTFESSSAAFRLDARNITIHPAGIDAPNSGHHHLFINTEIVEEGEVIPTGEGIVHLGGGQTTHTYEHLSPGSYVVIAVLGDYEHRRIPGAKTDTVRFTVN